MNKENIKNLIKKSLKILIKKDDGLIKKKVREECINHRLACHFEYLLSSEKKYKNHNVDLEYNKNYDSPKKTITDEKKKNVKAIRPDIIIHKRDNNEHNMIAFEIKKEYTNKWDRFKLEKLLEYPYKYRYGGLISYLPDKDYFIVKLLSKQNEKTIEYKFKIKKDKIKSS